MWWLYAVLILLLSGLILLVNFSISVLALISSMIVILMIRYVLRKHAIFRHSWSYLLIIVDFTILSFIFDWILG